LRISQPDFSNSIYAHSSQAIDANLGVPHILDFWIGSSNTLLASQSIGGSGKFVCRQNF
ncbi:hypothetical protein CMV_021233, partial [Castanea mollissima]